MGAENAKRYFPQEVHLIELELDHLRIVCSLEPSFWLDHPEIHDVRLSSWLESKRNSGKLATQEAPVAMIPCGKCSFRLQIMSKDEADYSFGGLPSTVYFSHKLSAAALLDRRRHNSGHKPDRRRVARLKVDDRKSPSANH
jgi:hypothetical protein